MPSTVQKIITLLLLLTLISAQQICLQQSCAAEVAGCDDACIAAMGKCMFSCTMSSLGCQQKCLGDNGPAQNLLECSFNKCINL